MAKFNTYRCQITDVLFIFSDMEKSANPHMKHAFFKWFLHNRKNDIRRFQKRADYRVKISDKSQNLCSNSTAKISYINNNLFLNN